MEQALIFNDGYLLCKLVQLGSHKNTLGISTVHKINFIISFIIEFPSMKRP